ncbi:hypothetical protein [Hydrogenimonas sp.]
MTDLSQPVTWPVIVGTIAVILAVTAVGVAWVRAKCPKNGEQ